MLAAQNYKFSPEGASAFESYIGLRRRQPLVLQRAFDPQRARPRAAAPRQSLFRAGGPVLIDDLMTIDAVDVLGSRVFEADSPSAEKVPQP